MFYKLPDDILRQIYEFDDTYRKKYDIVMKSLVCAFNKYHRYTHIHLFHNDLQYNINQIILTIFDFVRNKYQPLEI